MFMKTAILRLNYPRGKAQKSAPKNFQTLSKSLLRASTILGKIRYLWMERGVQCILRFCLLICIWAGFVDPFHALCCIQVIYIICENLSPRCFFSAETVHSSSLAQVTVTAQIFTKMNKICPNFCTG